MRPTLFPTLRLTDGKILIVEHAELAGRQVVRVDGTACRALTPNGRCGLIAGHAGLCWDCSVELIEADGPWAVVAAK